MAVLTRQVAEVVNVLGRRAQAPQQVCNIRTKASHLYSFYS